MDELALINVLIAEVNVVIHILNGIGSKFKELLVAIRAPELPIRFEVLYDNFIDYEEFLKKRKTTTLKH